MARRAISSSFFEEALDCLRQRGLDVEACRAAAGVSGETPASLSAEQIGAIWWSVATVLDDELMGLGGRPMRLGSLELMCHCLLHTKTLDEALRRALRFLAVVAEDPAPELRVAGNRAEIVLEEPGPAKSAFAYRTFGIIVHGVACWLVGRRLPLLAVDFRCPPPRSPEYRSFFGAPVHFGRPETRFVLDASLLALAPIRDEHALREFLREAPAKLLAPYHDEAGLTAKVHACLRRQNANAWPSLEELAAEMRAPASTLRHRLAAEGQTYRAIKDEIRRSLAIERLSRTRVNVADIAADLGFAEPSAFHRAFRKWTGKSPAEFRREVTR
jgi:AraC-like DNA-binding protein